MSDKKDYIRPELTEFGTIAEVTAANQGGPGKDGGTPPYHKIGSS